jgi:hypothetical protein
MECEFCKNTFKTKNSLYNHQNRAKYCIKLQNREEAIKTYTCAWCDKSFIREDCFKTHKNKCTYISEDVLKLREEIARQREEIARQREENIIQREEIASLKMFKKLYDKKDDDITKIANKDTTTNTTNTRNTIIFPEPLDLSREHIEPIAEKLTIDHVREGQLGIVKFTHDNVLTTEDGKRKYICCDRSRNIYMFKGKNGEIVRDYQARNLSKAIEPIREKAGVIGRDEIEKFERENREGNRYDEERVDAMMSGCGSIMNLDNDNTGFCKTLNKLL